VIVCDLNYEQKYGRISNEFGKHIGVYRQVFKHFDFKKYPRSPPLKTTIDPGDHFEVTASSS
jgi:hypothetical protein